jgi:hypothetical protein
MLHNSEPYWNIKKAELKLRMVFGKRKVQRQETVLPALLRAVNAKPSSRTVIQSQFKVPPAKLRKELKVVFSQHLTSCAAMFFWTNAFTLKFTRIVPVRVSFSMTYAIS